MSAEEPRAAPPKAYDERYFLEDCGGAEFFRTYGARVLKPQLAYALKRAELAPGMRVLDLGCGRGELLAHARRAGAEAVGADFSPEALKLAAEVSGCRTVLCGADKLPFPDASFERVFLVGVIDHLSEDQRARCFEEIGRVLAPGGAALVHTCANRLYYKLWTYEARRALAGLLGMKRPSEPRSEEDRRLHVNEHSAGDLERFFARIGWEAEVSPMPNYKMLARELYGDPLPDRFPLAPAPAWKARLYLGLLFRAPFKQALAREIFALARPRKRP